MEELQYLCVIDSVATHLHCIKYPRAKYKHKWDSLKKDWVLWNKLKGSEIGLGWDVAKETIATTDEWWERKLMVCFV